MKEEKDVCSLAWGRCEVSCVVSMTENHTPVGSGRFRDQTRDCFCIPGLFLSLLIQDLPPSVSLLCREVNSRHPCFRIGNVIFPIMYDSMNSSFCSQTPKKRERITLC